MAHSRRSSDGSAITCYGPPPGTFPESIPFCGEQSDKSRMGTFRRLDRTGRSLKISFPVTFAQRLRGSNIPSPSNELRYSTFPSRTVSPVITWPDGKNTLAITRNAAQWA